MEQSTRAEILASENASQSNTDPRVLAMSYIMYKIGKS